MGLPYDWPRNWRTRRASSASSVSPSSSNCIDAGDQVSLKLRDIADSHTYRTGALGLTPNFAGDSSSKMTCITPF